MPEARDLPVEPVFLLAEEVELPEMAFALERRLKGVDIGHVTGFFQMNARQKGNQYQADAENDRAHGCDQGSGCGEAFDPSPPPLPRIVKNGEIVLRLHGVPFPRRTKKPHSQ